MRMPAGGIVPGATAGAAVAFVAAWFLPWMGATAAIPLLGHAFTLWFWFLQFEPPGPGAGLEMVALGLLGLTAIWAAGCSAHRTSAVTAAGAIAPGVHLVVRDHPGLSSGPGALVAVVAVAVIAVAQTAAAFHVEWGWTTAGVAVAAVLAVAAGFGGEAYASARDVDATTSGPGGAVVVGTHDNVLVGITARDSVTGVERWHYWARDSVTPSVGLSADGGTAVLVVDRVYEQDALAFNARTGQLLWRRVLASGGWIGPPASRPGPSAEEVLGVTLHTGNG